MFLSPHAHIDIGSIGKRSIYFLLKISQLFAGCISSLTGGDIFFHPRFDPVHDGPVLQSQLRRVLKRTTVYDCMMRIRASTGLRVTQHRGNFHQYSTTDLAFGTLDSDKALSVNFVHAKGLDTRQYACIQSAVLYTTADGQRRVRVCNLALQVAPLAADVFRYADMDAVISYLMRECGPFLNKVFLYTLMLQRCLTNENDTTEAHTRRHYGKMLINASRVPQKLCRQHSRDSGKSCAASLVPNADNWCTVDTT